MAISRPVSRAGHGAWLWGAKARPTHRHEALFAELARIAAATKRADAAARKKGCSDVKTTD